MKEYTRLSIRPGFSLIRTRNDRRYSPLVSGAPSPVYSFRHGNFRSGGKNVRVATTFYLNWMGNGEESAKRVGRGRGREIVGIAHEGTISGYISSVSCYDQCLAYRRMHRLTGYVRAFRSSRRKMDLCLTYAASNWNAKRYASSVDKCGVWNSSCRLRASRTMYHREKCFVSVQAFGGLDGI